MARDHARLQVAIWSSRDYRALRFADQWLYEAIMSQPRLSYCGVIDYLPSRFAKLASDLTTDDIEAFTKRLEVARYVVVDRDTHELLLRTFVRHDGLLSSPNMVKAMLKDRACVLSERLREAIDEELWTAYQREPKAAGWKGFRAAEPELFAMVTRKGSRNGSEKGSGKE